MFDPEHKYDEKFARELGVYADVRYTPLSKSSEVELKYLLAKPSTYRHISTKLNEQANRHIAPDTYEQRRNILVTYNLDTKDQIFRRNGLSTRIRLAYDPYDRNAKSHDIDITVKTLLSNTSKSYARCDRGEWEAKIYDLIPDLTQIQTQNPENDTPIPDLVTNGNITPDMLFVESVGATWRTTYSSGHKLPNSDIIVIYEHTEDANIFNSPLCLPSDSVSDFEAEIERKGVLHTTSQSLDSTTLEKHLDTSLKSTNALLVSYAKNSMLNTNSKSARGKLAVEMFHQQLPDMASNNPTTFNNQVISPAINYSLSLGIRPSEVPIHNLQHNMRELHKTTEVGTNLPQQETSNIALSIVK